MYISRVLLRSFLFLIHYFRLHELFQGVKMDLDDEVYIYLLDNKAPMKNHNLYEVYKIYNEGPPVINHLGVWSPDTYSLNFEEFDKNSRRRDLKVSIFSLSENMSGKTILLFSIRESFYELQQMKRCPMLVSVKVTTAKYYLTEEFLLMYLKSCQGCLTFHTPQLCPLTVNGEL